MARRPTKVVEIAQAAEMPTLANLINTQRTIAVCSDLILSGSHQGVRAAEIQQSVAFLQSLHRQISDQIDRHPEAASPAQAKEAHGQKN